MAHNYAYLVGTVAVGIIWGILFFLRKDVRKPMMWSSWYFLFVMTLGFLALALVGHIPAYMSINPGYWNPDTLFDLNRLTGGYAIEDAFFQFFIGGIAAALYEEVFGKRIGHRHAKHKPHLAIKIGVAAAIVIALLKVNLIYALIGFGFVGAGTIWIQRRDLLTQSLLGGMLFFIVYTASYLAVLFFFPDFVTAHYNFQNISGVLIFGLPLEEYLFALSFGCMWTPLYEYAFDVR